MLFTNIGPKRALQINKRTNMAPTSIKNETNLAQGGGKGYQQINKNMKKNKQTANARHQNEKTCFIFRRAQLLGVNRCFMKTSDNILYKTEHKTMQTKTENEPIAIEQMTFQKPPCPNGMVITMVSWKQGCATRHHYKDEHWSFLATLVRFGAPFRPSRIPKGSVNRDFGHQVLKIIEKRVSNNETRKNIKF